VRGSPADFGRPAASGRGRSCQGASPGGKDPDLGIGCGEAHRGGLATMMQLGGGELARAGRRSGGERRLGVHGAAVSSSRGRCGDGGARRWLEVALDGRVASTTEGGGRLGASMVACGGRWLSGWLGVAQRHTRAVWGWSALRAKECGDEGAEEHGKSRAVHVLNKMQMLLLST
jgi:hypothetical protein